MQTIIGRLTADAKIGKTNEGREVVNFSIAENFRFKPKDSDEVKVSTTFYDCAYWFSIGIAEHLRKGRLVEITGRIGSKAYLSHDGTPKSSLTLKVSRITLHDTQAKSNVDESTANTFAQTDDDLPF